MKKAVDYENVRSTIVRTLVGFALFFLTIRWASGAMLHQLKTPPLRAVGYNFTAWLYRLTGVEDLLLNDGVTSKIFTAVLLISGAAAVIKPLLRANLFLFWICYLTYALLFNVGTAVTGHSQAFMTVALIPLWAAPHGRFSLWWSAIRYYACWIFGSAFLFKIFRGAFWNWEDGERTVRANFALFFYTRPAWWWTRLIGLLLNYPWLINAGYKLFILLEGTFIAGFFTRRWDWWLALSTVALILSTLVFADANFLEMLPMVAVFLPPNFWQRKPPNSNQIVRSE